MCSVSVFSSLFKNDYFSLVLEAWPRTHGYGYGYDRVTQAIFEKLKHDTIDRIPLRHGYGTLNEVFMLLKAKGDVTLRSGGFGPNFFFYILKF